MTAAVPGRFVVTAGPTISAGEIRELAPSAEVVAPIAFGDTHAYQLMAGDTLLIIDGVFLQQPAVRHKELLQLLDAGVRVAGCSSMGALRAAELAPFGMLGYGHIYDGYRSGHLQADDEVAMVHGDADAGYPVIVDALVNLRATLTTAARAGLITTALADRALTVAGGLPFTHRSWQQLLPQAGVDVDQVPDLAQQLRRARVDAKHADAVTALTELNQPTRAGFHTPAGPRRSRPPATLWTHRWPEQRRRSSIRAVADAQVVAFLQLFSAEYWMTVPALEQFAAWHHDDRGGDDGMTVRDRANRAIARLSSSPAPALHSGPNRIEALGRVAHQHMQRRGLITAAGWPQQVLAGYLDPYELAAAAADPVLGSTLLAPRVLYRQPMLPDTRHATDLIRADPRFDTWADRAADWLATGNALARVHPELDLTRPDPDALHELFSTLFSTGHLHAELGRRGFPSLAAFHAAAAPGYASLCRVISEAQLRGGVKGRPVYDLDEITHAAQDNWLVLTGCRKGAVRAALEAGLPGVFGWDPARRALAELVDRFGRHNVAVELTYAREPLADERYAALTQLAGEAGVVTVATTAAHYHHPDRRRLAMVMAAIRARSSLDELDGWLPAWADAGLRSGGEMAARFARHPGVVDAAGRLGAELAFDLRLVAPNLPPFDVPAGFTGEMDYLRHLAHDGAHRRYGPPGPANHAAYTQLEHELGIIGELNFPGYFLVVWDITRFCRQSGILSQGRGSAANSVVCYALGVTAADPIRYGLLFERFLSPERDGPPDIDVDIEADRREEVIQYVYTQHGRQHAAQVANVITYRPKSAVRDVAGALGYSVGQRDAWSKQVERRYWTQDPDDSTPLPTAAGDVDRATAAGGGSGVPVLVAELAGQLQDTPRHLGIHSGGMVICDRPIIEVCPVEWGRMPGRTVLQWDKESCASAGLVKFDLLGLGMLSALRYCFDFIQAWYGTTLALYDIPADDPLVYDMMCAADTVGVFQIESRAQQATLPRLKPRNFRDLSIEIALIRPGPIQGNSVHPYLRRRDGLEPVTYPHPDMEPFLKKTLGVPLFQEQLMQLAVTVAGFTPGEADELRRAMGSKRSTERMQALRQRLYDGMATKGVTGPAADDIYDKIKGFAAFGFPESHALSFAYLALASTWLKLYYPAAFLASLLNAQPMGFYSPQELAHDARRHGILVHSPGINTSPAAAGLEACTTSAYTGPGPAQPAVRVGLGAVRTISTDTATQIVAERDAGGPFSSQADLARRVGLSTEQLEALATAGAFTDAFGTTRRAALWSAGTAATVHPGHLPLLIDLTAPDLPQMTQPEQLIADLWATGISKIYPTALIRDRLHALGITPADQLATRPDRSRVTVGGIVTHRQRPGTAKGTTFISLADETGLLNIIISPAVWKKHAHTARNAGGLIITGTLERGHGAINIIAERIDRLPLGVHTRSRDFR